MADSLYTTEELATLIKALDVKIGEGFTQGRLDTGMSEQEWRSSVAEMRKQREYYFQLWQQQSGNGGNVAAVLPVDRWIS